MKPIIIYQETNSENKIMIDKEEFEKLIAEVYEQGKQDGMQYYTYPVVVNPIVPNVPTHIDYPKITWLMPATEIIHPDYQTISKL